MIGLVVELIVGVLWFVLVYPELRYILVPWRFDTLSGVGGFARLQGL